MLGMKNGTSLFLQGVSYFYFVYIVQNLQPVSSAQTCRDVNEI